MQILPSSQYSFVTSFFRQECAAGILLMLAAVLAILVANSPLLPYYELLLSTPVEVKVGAFEIAKPLLLWINDGLMAVFFFLIGLELKREFLEGGSEGRRFVVLPAVGAVGGMLVPALIYGYFNWHDAFAIQGWAIPAATDIAFALGVLSLLGSRVPLSVKVFLTSLAIFDDLAAIVIIALFYSANISIQALFIAALCILLLFWLNRKNVTSHSVYILVGAMMWVALLKSGVHATLAGVITAMFIPMVSRTHPSISPVKTLQHDLHPVVAFFILPVFAFANAGFNLSGLSLEQVFHGVPMGIAAGLFFGKQIGIFSCCLIAVMLGWTKLPKGMDWWLLYGTALLCGIGFTMSLFIGSLSFEGSGQGRLFDERLGILVGSLLSGVAGYWVLFVGLPKTTQADDDCQGPT